MEKLYTSYNAVVKVIRWVRDWFYDAFLRCDLMVWVGPGSGIGAYRRCGRRRGHRKECWPKHDRP
jgi:hypothetical protein